MQRPARTAVGVEGVAGSTSHRTFDCDGYPTSTERHRQLGGGVRMERQSEGPVRGGGRVHAVRGELAADQGLDRPDRRRSPYALVSAAGYLAADFEHWGLEGGLTLDAAINPDAEGRRILPTGWLLGHAGGEFVHGELFSGSVDPFTVWLFGGGLRVEQQELRLRVDVGMGSRWIGTVEGDHDGFLLLSANRQYVDVLVQASAEYWLDERWGIFGRLQTGSQAPMGMIGVRMALGRREQPPPPSP